MKNSEHRRLGDRAGAEGEQELMEHSWRRRRREDYPWLSCLSLWLDIGNLSRGCPLLLVLSGLSLHFWWDNMPTPAALSVFCECMCVWECAFATGCLPTCIVPAWLPQCVYASVFGHVSYLSDANPYTDTHTASYSIDLAEATSGNNEYGPVASSALSTLHHAPSFWLQVLRLRCLTLANPQLIGCCLTIKVP